MSKLTKRKRDFNYCPSIYEQNLENRKLALKTAEQTPEEIKKPIKYDLKR